MSGPKTVVDQNGVRYEIAGLLGQGGQGEVYGVKGGRLAVKVLPGGTAARRERLRNQLAHVRRLPLSDLYVARPLEMLRPPHTGYVMELLGDMVPLKRLIEPGKNGKLSVEWYLGGGGLRRRLDVLGKTARLFSKLHGRGLTYSDPSPGNIFISTDPNEHEVWLLDCDNLRYESEPGVDVHTPGYGAPELVTGAFGVSTLSDSYALSVIAFQTLTLAHPFIGDQVNDGGPELEEAAFAGKLPWIDDLDDDSNRATFGVPRDWVLSGRLHEAFGRAFGGGRVDPSRRPGANEWADRLFTAADATIRCPACSGTFYFTSLECPWCSVPRPAFVTGVLKIWDPGFKGNGGILSRPSGDGTERPVLVGHSAIADGDDSVVTRRLAFGDAGAEADRPVVSLSFRGNQLQMRCLDGNSYFLSAPGGGQQSELGDQVKNLRLEERKESWKLHFGGEDSLHRVLSFELRRGQST